MVRFYEAARPVPFDQAPGHAGSVNILRNLRLPILVKTGKTGARYRWFPGHRELLAMPSHGEAADSVESCSAVGWMKPIYNLCEVRP
jgi:hypothetical protein